MTQEYVRSVENILEARLKEQSGDIIFIAGPRQVGKTTLIRKVFSRYQSKDYKYFTLEDPDTKYDELLFEQDYGPKNIEWLVKQWNKARAIVRESGEKYILIFDEIQKLNGWSNAVKGLWDIDRAEGLNLQIVLSGSSPLLMQVGMNESLMGRFEPLRMTHWSYREMQETFDFNLEDYIYFGGYPGLASYVGDERRWRELVLGKIITPSIETDVLALKRIDKPALLRQLFDLSCHYSGQIVALNKMLGSMDDAGNTTTLTGYLTLLNNAGLVTGIQKYAGRIIVTKASQPKHNVLNMALMSAKSGYTKAEAIADRTYWGRMVESAVGAHLINTGQPHIQVYYWRDHKSREVDFVIEQGNKLALIEVKSGSHKSNPNSFKAFEEAFQKTCRNIVVGNGGVSIAEFLSYPAEYWL